MAKKDTAVAEVDAEEAAKAAKKAKKAAKAAAAAEAAEAEENVPAKKKKAKAAVEEEEEAPVAAKKAKKAKKEAAVEAEVEEEPEVDEAAAKAARKAAKKAAKAAAAAAAEEEEEVPATPKKSKKKKSVDEAEDAAEEVEAPKAKKAKVDDSEKAAPPKEGGGDPLTVFIRGLPWAVDEATLTKDFTECGAIESLKMPLNEEGKPRGIAFVKYEAKAGCDAALKFDNTDYGGRTINVAMAGEGNKGKGKDGKGKDGKGKDGKGKDGGKGHDNENTVFVRGLPWSTTEDVLRKDFGECGDIESLRLPLNEEGQPRGISFIKYKTAEAVEKALKFDDTDYGGRTINVSKAGDAPGKGKGKDGKDGKGKGKDGKGKDGKGKKGKGKKGKEGGLTAAGFAARDGAIVESTGEKKTFADSDDE